MSGFEPLLIPVLLVPLLVFLAFSGCEYEWRYTTARIYLMLHYDPNMMISGSRVVINRVDFVVRPGDRDDTNTQALIVGEPPVYDTSGWTRTTGSALEAPGIGLDPIVIDPANGDFVLTITVAAIYLMPERFSRWTVTCNAYRDADAPSPAYAAEGEIQKDIPEEGHVDFAFKLDAKGSVVPDPS